MKVFYVTQVSKQGINIRSLCSKSSTYSYLETQNLINCKSSLVDTHLFCRGCRLFTLMANMD